MIFLKTNKEPVVHINFDLVRDYKSQGDIYLANIKRELTKQLVYFKMYSFLQKVNNSYYYIISKLLDSTYTNKEDIDKDYKLFVKTCDMFTKELKPYVSDAVYKSISENVNSVILLMNKIVYIIKNICFNTEDK